jgi:crotonobetainyl-CoA:carnitine CoA-transferase CaiB-like acyl-CoA transferase
MASDRNSRAAPLAGLKVVDATTFLAGPFSGLMLADLGAEVVKVEPPDGDPLRRMKSRWHPTGPMAANVNRNKKSVVVDLRDPSGREAFFDLVQTADAVLLNMRASAANSLGIGDAALEALNPRLVRVWITGYGGDGPRGNDPAFDSAVQAYAGLIATQTASGDPAPMRTYVADKACGMFVVQGVLSALLKRAATGTGDRLDISLLDATAYFSFPDVFEDFTFLDQDSPEVVDGTSAIVASTSDGLLVLAPASGWQIKAALDVVGHPEWKPALIDTANRGAMLSVLTEKLRTVTKTATTAQWVERFSAADVPAAPVLGLAEHLDDPQVIYNGTYQVYEHPRYGKVRAVRFPVNFGGSDAVQPSPFPAPGESHRQ